MTSEGKKPGPLRIFVLAGEHSGDQLGAQLMKALKAETDGQVRFVGVGGERMREEGLESLFPMAELSLIGLTEILPHLRRLLRRIREVEQAVRKCEPDAIVTIDSPSFTLRVMKRLRGVKAPRIHYVAPQVWAWKPWRARKMAAYLDHLLALLPFEPPIFERHGLKTTFVGHSVVEVAGRVFDGPAFRRNHDIPQDAPTICLLPGSRESEVRRLLPIFGEAAAIVHRDMPALQVILPTVSNVQDEVRRNVRDWPMPTTVVAGAEDKYGAFAASHAAIAASGTIAVELAVAGLPTLIAYHVSPITAFLARRLIRVKYVSLANLVMDREVQPEMLQDDCTPERLAEAIRPLLADQALRESYVAAGREVACTLGYGGEAPSHLAARAILDTIHKAQTATPER